ncbi:hypothetical protein CTheo_4002 [Ceratobasidium theobromae]|uniref:Membrane magnesium transporter n=1 Tax=Ceratobasidium theobromae TaxID=1582974 RepID=A0A5N5QL84_9AGAM|nr:hypothetical protein CTheo_4002 [Ceratobasidium theobromae]
MGSPVGKGMIALAILGLLHAAYSAYEHLSLLKALDRPTPTRLPPDVSSCAQPLPASCFQIIIECLAALGVFLVGVTSAAPGFKENTWASEMRSRKIEDVHSRLGFASFNHRGNNARLVWAPMPIQLFFSFANCSILRLGVSVPCLAARTSTNRAMNLRGTAAPGGGRTLAEGGSVHILRGLIREMRCPVAAGDMVCRQRRGQMRMWDMRAAHEDMSRKSTRAPGVSSHVIIGIGTGHVHLNN